MISLIYGPKGSGKTKRIIDAANSAVESAKGSVIYITDKGKHSKELNYKIRFVDTAEYGINAPQEFLGFIKGVLASDNDIERVFIDGLARMTCVELGELEQIYAKISELAEKERAEFVLTVSCETLPPFLSQYTK